MALHLNPLLTPEANVLVEGLVLICVIFFAWKLIPIILRSWLPGPRTITYPIYRQPWMGQ
ncbi:MAG: hypothetical protein P4M09_17365 [Devosia sp.]|nr:hypothetical protein [Devosia sp.]